MVKQVTFRINILGISVVFFFIASCSKVQYHYEPQHVDLTVAEENGRLMVKGSSVLSLRDSFVWGASPLKEDNMYYLFFSAWESGEGVPYLNDSWVQFSKIGLASSKFPDKNYKSKGIIIKGMEHNGDSSAWDALMVHNPHIRKFNDKYYLYYIGTKDPGVQPPGSPGEKVNRRNRAQQSQQIGVIEFDSIEDLLIGKFDRMDSPLLSPRTRVKAKDIVNPSTPETRPKPDNVIVVNPSVVYRPSDGKYLMYFKGNMWDPAWRGVHGVAIADNPSGPFETQDFYVFDIEDEQGRKVSAEDPYVWYHKNDKCFYAVMKDFTGKLTGGVPGLAMMTSVDGENWERAKQSLFMKKELELKNGEVLKLERFERPQLLINKNGDPIVLFAACSIGTANPKDGNNTFNVHIPIKKVIIND